MSQLQSPSKRLLNRTHKIAVRLRVVFILIGLVTATAGISAILQGKTILNAHSALTKSALPMLTVAQSTERNLSAMFLVLENIDSYKSATALIDAHAEISKKTENVRQNLKALRLFDVSDRAVSDLDQQLNAAETSSLKVLSKQSALFELEDQIQATLAKLSLLQKDSQRILDDFAFEFTTQMDGLIRASKRDDQSIITSQYDKIDALFVASLNVSAISFGLDDVISLTRSAVQTNGSTRSDRVSLQIIAKLHNLINRLTYLPKGDARRDLANQISTLRSIVSKESGIFAHLQSQQQFKKEFEENRATHLRLISEVSQMSTDLVARTLLMVERISQRLNLAVNHLIWIIAGAFLAVLLTVTLTNQIVINHQFYRRINMLNNSVSAIAKGQLDHPIRVTGPDELGDMARALAIFRDNAEDLRRSNVELEKFAYVAAHDLKSPLHAIHDLSTWAIEDDENKLSVQSYEYLTILQQRVVRLKSLLNDLLSYARVGQNEPDVVVVNLCQLVNEQALFADPDDDYRIRYQGFETDILIQLTPVQQIIGNLLNNAVKHHDRPKGTVLVTANTTVGMLVLTVSDNGPGIEQRYQQRIFELFQTLRPRDEVEGSGLGLAIVNKLVSRRKGRIEVISDPAIRRGTTFKITLPLSQANPAAMPTDNAIAA
jgi:signal transduction histidine kinase